MKQMQIRNKNNKWTTNKCRHALIVGHAVSTGGVLLADIAARERLRPCGPLHFALLLIGKFFGLEHTLAPTAAAPATIFVGSTHAASVEGEAVIITRKALHAEALGIKCC